MAALEPISLGYACEVKYQLSRALYFRKFPDGDDHECRRLMMTAELGQRTFQRHIFDWQITPFEALLAYLESNFRGVFERSDLAVDNASGEVVHRALNTRHPHDFHPVDGRLDEAVVDAQYGAARSKFDHLADRFRRHLREPGDFLYVFRQIRMLSDTERLRDLLAAGHPDHRFRLLYVGYEGEDQMLGGAGDLVVKAWTPAAPDKPPARVWEGDDATWEAILRPFDLKPHHPDWITRTALESLDAPASGLGPGA